MKCLKGTVFFKDAVDYKDLSGISKIDSKTQTSFDNKLSKAEIINRLFFEDVTDRMKTRSKTRATRAVNEVPEVINIDDIDGPRLPEGGVQKHGRSQSKTSQR